VSTDKRERQKANRANRVAAAEATAAKDRVRSRIVTYGSLAAVVVLVIVGAFILLSDNNDETPVDAGAIDNTDDLLPDDSQQDFVFPEFDTEISDDCPAADGSSERTIDFDATPPTCIDVAKSYTAVFDTTEGEIQVELDAASTPYTVNNFVYLARYGYYDETTIFRTDPSIDIIQGGAPHTESASDPGPGYTIPDEPTFAFNAGGSLVGPHRYSAGQLVMARSQGADAAGAQFFFVTGPGASLLDGQGTYVVFGNADDAGLGVLKAMIGLHVDDPSSGLGGGPSRDITINSVTILES
jgi:cyclophilin family peptidyl-prolyl cis-trans isomerase